jgi:transcriptional regulator with XRE-family HTH domain
MRKRREVPTPRMVAIGARIHALRKQQGLTLQVVAKRVGMTHQHLSKIERGLVQAPYETLGSLGEVLGVSFEALVMGQEASGGGSTDSFSPHYHVNSWELARLCASLSLPLALGLPL